MKTVGRTSCGNIAMVLALTMSALPAWADDALDGEREAAIAWFDAAYAGQCQPTAETAGLFEGGEMPRRYEVRFRPSYADADEPPETAVVYEFFCSAGAYNVQFAYAARVDEHFAPLPLSVPSLDIRYAPDGADAEVRSIRVAGYEAYLTATNPEFDPDTLTLTARAYWRGLGDAWSESVWRFRDGAFVLKRHVVDATYDDKVEPQLTLEY